MAIGGWWRIGNSGLINSEGGIVADVRGGKDAAANAALIAAAPELADALATLLALVDRAQVTLEVKEAWKLITAKQAAERALCVAGRDPMFARTEIEAQPAQGEG